MLLEYYRYREDFKCDDPVPIDKMCINYVYDYNDLYQLYCDLSLILKPGVQTG